MPHRRITSLILSFILLSCHSIIAAEAFFSRDGTTVTMISPSGGILKTTIANGTVTKAPLPSVLKESWVESIAQGADGETLFLADNAVWVWNAEQKPQIRRICSTSPVVDATDLFVATQPGTRLTDCIFISGNLPDGDSENPFFYGRMPGKRTFSPVFCRRTDNALGGVFDKDGRLFFVCNGDLWEGGIQRDEGPGLERFGTLTGARIAPVALLNTDEGNSGGLGIHQAFPAGNWIYLHLQGRHESAIIRTPIPTKTLYSPASQEQPKLASHLQTMSSLLSKTRVIFDSPGEIHGFCATMLAGEPLIFYCTNSNREGKGDAMMLWKDAGQPRVIGHLPVE